jgi:pimeloyl-ACP methyl ester carboxylesterase
MTDIKTLNELLNDDRYMAKVMSLPDGRQLSYSQAGHVVDDDVATETPPTTVIFQGGLMASSLSVVIFHAVAQRLNLRIIAIDYPGVGDSTIQPNRKFTDWPVDVLDFVNTIVGPTAKFALLCHCMGGPHALAIMDHPLLQKRILSSTLLSPWLLPFSLSSNMETKTFGTRFLQASRSLPTVVQDSVIPSLATMMTTSTLSVAGSVGGSVGGSQQQEGQSKQQSLAITQRIVSYSSKHGQAGNHQMVRMALQEQLVIPTNHTNDDNDDDDDIGNTKKDDDADSTCHCPYAISIFCGDKDELISQDSCRQLTECLRCSSHCTNVQFFSIEGANHNSIMGVESLSRILSTLCIPDTPVVEQTS